MKAQSILDIDRGSYTEIVRYVLPGDSRNEEAVFVSARVDDNGVFTPIELYFVPPDGFVHRSPFFLELTDDTRAAVVKRDARSDRIGHRNPLTPVAIPSGVLRKRYTRLP